MHTNINTHHSVVSTIAMQYQFLLYDINGFYVDEPEIIGLPSELRAIEGQTFSFPSHVTGKPVPDVYWYLNSR